MFCFRHFVLVSVFISFIFAGTGCNDGNGGGSQNQASVYEGVWTGTYTASNGSLQFPASALITSDGLVGIDIDNGVVFYGLLESSDEFVGNENISSGAMVRMSAAVNSDQIEAVVTQGAQALAVGNTFRLTYDTIYERASSLDDLVGTWSGNNFIMIGGSGISYDWSLTFQSDGTFVGTASSLIIEGAASLVDSTKNEYSFTMTVTSNVNDPYIGDYQGFATLSDTSTMNDTLVMFLKRTGADPILGRLILH